MTMRRTAIVIAAILCIYLDSVFFANVTFWGARPNMLLALVVSLGVLLGQISAATVGLAAGVIVDLLFNKAIGLSAISYIIAGYIGGFFYKKFYADNVIVPAVTAAVCELVRQHIFLLAALIGGSKFNYTLMFLTYYLPCSVLTGGICILLHLVMKPLLRERINKTSQDAQQHGQGTQMQG